MWKKWLAFSGMLALVILLDPTHTPAQPIGGKREFGKSGFPGGPGDGPSGGGFPGRERGMGGPGGPPMGGPGSGGMSRGAPDPERSWSMIQKLAQSSGDTVDLSKIPPQTHAWMKGMAEKSGGTPLPTSGVWTKAAYLDHHARSEAARASFTGGSPPAPGMPAPGAPMTPGGYGASGYGASGYGASGYGGNMSGGDDAALRRIREQDKNGDGKVSFDEADRRLKERWKEMDRNSDGYIDLDEYKVALGGGNRGPGGMGGDPSGGGWGGGGWGGGGWGERPGEKKETEEERPVAMRYGKLPKDLPGWFDELDSDKDGQVGLYEWRKASRAMTEFTEMDLNSDGLVTADEYLRFARQKNIDTKITAYEAGDRPAGNWGLGDPLNKGPGSIDPKSKFGPGSVYGPGGPSKGDTSKSDSSKGDSNKGEKGEKGKGNRWNGGKN